MLAGMAFGLLHGVLTVPFGLSHVVLAFTLLATAAAYFAYRLALPEVTGPPKITPFAPWPIPGLAAIPLIGEGFFAQTPLTYAGFAVAGLTALVLFRTPLGLALRAASEPPGRGRGAGPFRHCAAHRRGCGRIGADGRGRRLPDAFRPFPPSSSRW